MPWLEIKVLTCVESVSLEPCVPVLNTNVFKLLPPALRSWSRPLTYLNYLRLFRACGFLGALQTTVAIALSYRRVRGGDLVW